MTNRAMVALLTVALLSVDALSPAPVWAVGSSTPSAPVESRPSSPEQQAEAAYKKGLRIKAKAWRAEEQALATSSKRKRAKHEKRAKQEYIKAIEAYNKALENMPEHYKAANELGYALRRIGNYEQAIGAYNYALKIHPGFLEAIEYRGEAYLALERFDDAREAYMHLFREDPELAAQLMTVMQSWVAERAGRPGAKARNFAEWVAEREQLGVLGVVPGDNDTGW